MKLVDFRPEPMSPSVRGRMKQHLCRYSVQNGLRRALTYAALLLGAAVYLLPFLWMVSSSFKDLETVFEYPPTLLPMETLTAERGGKRYKLADYTPPGGQPVRSVLIADQRPGQYRVEPVGAGGPQAREWVAASAVEVRRRIHFRVENYRAAWTAAPFTQFLMNTLIITGLGILGQVLSASLVAFGFARLRWPGRNLLFLVVLATMMLPGEVTMIPTYLIFRRLGWIDTFLPLIVPSFLGGGAFSIFLFRQFFMTLPRELDEAARVDGCSSFAIYWHILMPLCKPILATLAVFSFVANWNDFLTPLIYLNSADKFTLAVGLRFFQGVYNTEMQLLMAASTLVLLPVLLVFFLGQRYFVKSIVLTGIKG
ncbi:MAG TPA: carbohydrate ABC transporter permease [Chthonomonadaceae bacterium]|nr:carbohydrate ABC transporter permease [Chthonomonadaceae bacterium]